MLAQLLGIAVGLGSVTLYIAAFFFPEVHRKHDFFWSGLGMFYGLVLWVCAGQMTGALLLGQTVSVVLLGWLGWQTLRLRRVTTPVELQTPATPEAWRGFRAELGSLAQDLLGLLPLLGSRWRSDNAASASCPIPDQGVSIRASSVREIGYEYLDDIEDEPPAPPRPAAPRQAVGKAAPAGRPSQPVAVPSGGPGLLGKVVIVTDWLGDLVRSLSAPKPPRPVIEIPPRSPSIPPPAAASPASTEAVPASSAPLAAAVPSPAAVAEAPGSAVPAAGPAPVERGGDGDAVDPGEDDGAAAEDDWDDELFEL